MAFFRATRLDWGFSCSPTRLAKRAERLWRESKPFLELLILQVLGLPRATGFQGFALPPDFQFEGEIRGSGAPGQASGGGIGCLSGSALLFFNFGIDWKCSP
jgi:hypothetical protein